MYAVHAPRNVRAFYYAAEFGIRGAHRLLSVESDGSQVTRTAGGTAGKCLGLYRRKRDAEAALRRVLTIAANTTGRISQDLAWASCAQIVPATSADFPAPVRPFADML